MSNRLQKRPHNFIDLTNKNVKNWLVLKDTNKRKRRDIIWLCECLKCHKNVEVSGNSLRNGSKNCIFCRKTRGRILTPTEEKTSAIRARYNLEARKRNLEFKLTQKEFNSIILKPCFYCNDPGKNKQIMYNKSYFYYNGIDRVDNTKGYILENCVPCCKNCNVHKKSITPDMIFKAYHFLFGKNNGI